MLLLEKTPSQRRMMAPHDIMEDSSSSIPHEIDCQNCVDLSGLEKLQPLHQQTLHSDESTAAETDSLESAPRRTVSFGRVQVHYHSVTMGDNPSVSDGMPVALDWKRVAQQVIDVDEFEQRKRKSAVGKLSSEERLEWLTSNGFSLLAVHRNSQEILRIQASRRQSTRLAEAELVAAAAQLLATVEAEKESEERLEEYLDMVSTTRKSPVKEEKKEMPKKKGLLKRLAKKALML